jgi:hypothetical protein
MSQALWEGRIEDITVYPWGIKVTAYGYYANLSDLPYATAYNDVWSTVLEDVLDANCVQISSDHSNMAATDIAVVSSADASYLDITCMEMVNKFLPLSDSTFQIWDFAIWEDRIPWLTTRASPSLNWECSLRDFSSPEVPLLSYRAKEMYNSAYARYQVAGVLNRTATGDDAGSQTKFGLTRRYAIPDLGGVAAATAEAARDAWLARNANLWPSFTEAPSLGAKVFDTNGIPFSSSWVRAGDVIRIKDLVPASATLDAVTLDALRTFFITETEYDAERQELTIYFDRDPQGLDALLAKLI